MFEKCRLICLGNDAGKQAWLAGGGDPALVFSANQLRGRLAIGEALPEQLVFDGSLKDCIHIFSEQSIEEGSEQINAYLAGRSRMDREWLGAVHLPHGGAWLL